MALYDASKDTSSKKSSIVDFFINIVPANIFKAFSNGSILQLVFFSIIFGIAIGFLSEDSSSRLINAVVSLKDSFQKLISWTMYGLPIGLIFLMGKQIAQVGVEILLAMVKFVVVFYVAGLAAILISTLIIWIKSGIKNPLTVLKKIVDPIIISFAPRNRQPLHRNRVCDSKACRCGRNSHCDSVQHGTFADYHESGQKIHRDKQHRYYAVQYC